MPALRRTSVEKAKEALAHEQALLEQVTAELGDLSAKRGDLAENPGAFAANDRRIAELASEQSRLAIVIARREADLAEAKRQAEHAAWESKRHTLEGHYRAMVAGSKEVAPRVDALREVLEQQLVLRAAAAEAEAEFRAHVPSDVDEFDLPSGRDEHAWPDLGQFAEMLAAGALQPEATATAERVKRDGQEAARRRNALQGARCGMPVAIRRLAQSGRGAAGKLGPCSNP